jgi:hypothetical protein
VGRWGPLRKRVRRQPRLRRRDIDTEDAHAFVARSAARDDGDGAARNLQGTGDNVDQLRVGRPLHRRRLEANQQRITAGASNAGFTRARNDANCDDDSI